MPNPPTPPPRLPRLIVSAWTTLDAMAAGPDDDMSWLRPDPDLMEYETSLVEEAATLLLGRVTHADFASYWPAVARGDIEAHADTRRYAGRLDQLDKVVVSRSGQVSAWPGSRRIARVTRGDVERIKQASSGDVVVYGSLSVIADLDALGLIDELHMVLHPVFLGEGKPLFADGCRAHLELVESRPFSSGAMLVRYRCDYGEASMHDEPQETVR